MKAKINDIVRIKEGKEWSPFADAFKRKTGVVKEISKCDGKDYYSVFFNDGTFGNFFNDEIQTLSGMQV